MAKRRSIVKSSLYWWTWNNNGGHEIAITNFSNIGGSKFPTLKTHKTNKPAILNALKFIATSKTGFYKMQALTEKVLSSIL